MKCKEMTIGSAICVFRYDNILHHEKVCFGLFFSHSEEDPDEEEDPEDYPYPGHGASSIILLPYLSLFFSL